MTATLIAYDFGREIHVLEIDEFGADAGEVDVLGTLRTGRDETLTDAGYRIVGAWQDHGVAAGVEVLPRT